MRKACSTHGILTRSVLELVPAPTNQTTKRTNLSYLTSLRLVDRNSLPLGIPTLIASFIVDGRDLVSFAMASRQMWSLQCIL